MGKRASRRRRGQRIGQSRPEGVHIPVEQADEGHTSDTWDVGVVLVHGIGRQKPRDTLASWTPLIHQALGSSVERHGRVASSLEQCSTTTAAGDVPSYTFSVGRPGRAHAQVLVTEAHWADSYRSRRLLGTLPWLARVGPALVLPFMPDARDSKDLSSSEEMFMPSAFRFLIRLLSALLPLIIIMALPALMQIAALAAVLAGIIVMTTNRRFNFAGHVRMAADEEAGLTAVEERLGQIIEATQRTSKRVVVVAHSQGGYLAHRTLTNLQLTNTTLITVGSGLRPITALRVMGSQPRYVIGCWGALLGTLCVEAWLLSHLDPGQPFSPFTQMGIDPGLLVAGFVVGVVPTELWNSATPAGVLDAAWNSLPKIDIDWWLLGAAMAYLVLFVILRRWGNEFVQAVRIPALRRTHWVDITTHHDLVGRLTVPTLPSGVDEKAVVVTGNAIADHVRYLNKPGITSWLIAEEIAAGLGHRGDPTVEQARQGALARSSRRHDLRRRHLPCPCSLSEPWHSPSAAIR